MEVLIVSKTKMGSGRVCIGGINFPDLQSVRLLDGNGNYHTNNDGFEIGQVYEMELKNPAKIVQPHTEDMLINRKKKLQKKFTDFNWLTKQKQIQERLWEGSVKEMFEKKLKWTGKRNGYIAAPNIPSMSTGFWIPDQDLKYNEGHYSYRTTGLVKLNFSLKYVGLEKPIDIIPAGTIVRVSLAKWWKPDDIDIEKRCYLQLSGWYN